MFSPISGQQKDISVLLDNDQVYQISHSRIANYLLEALKELATDVY
jgi:hypothetical protein